MKNLIILLILFLLIKPQALFGQVKPSSEYYFNGQKGDSTKNAKTQQDEAYQNDDYIKKVNSIVKFNPLTLFSGDMVFYFERKLDTRLSVEGGLGLTFRNYFFEAAKTFETGVDYGKNRNGLPGYSGRLSLRYFPEKNRKGLLPIEGLYFGPLIQYKVYRGQTMQCNPDFNGQVLNVKLLEYRKLLDAEIMFGYTTFYPGNFVMDVYGGIGVRSHNSRTYDCNWDEYSRSFVSAPQYNRNVGPVVSAGLKVGLGFNLK